MKNTSKDVDAYIAKAREDSRPILERFRKAVHAACPGAVEVMKWGSPHFDHHGILAGMFVTKAHVRIGFWRGNLLDDPLGIMEQAGSGDVGIMKVEKLSDLPKVADLRDYIRRAAALNEERAKAPRPKKSAPRTAAKVPGMPADLAAALEKSAKARKTFDSFSNTNKKEYIEWITEAKREATREKRVVQAVEWMAEGKPRNWKYMKEWR